MEVRHEDKIIINRYNISTYGYPCDLAPGPVARTSLACNIVPIGAIALNCVKVYGCALIGCALIGITLDDISDCLTTYSFGQLISRPINHKSHQVGNFQTYPLDQHPHSFGCHQTHTLGFNLLPDPIGKSDDHQVHCHPTDAINRKFPSLKSFLNPSHTFY